MSAATIVVPTDFSELAAGAAPWARTMAQALDAQIHCINVVREPHFYGGAEMGILDALPTTDDLQRDAAQRLAAFTAKHFAGISDRVVTAIVVGTPFVEIVRYARDNGATIIVMTTHGYSGLKHVFMGSTTEAVLRKADCPVLSVRSPSMPFEMP